MVGINMEVKMKFETIMAATRYWLDKDSELWLHKNASMLILRVQQEMGISKDVPIESITRCKRKIYEKGDHDPLPKEILEEYLRVKLRRQTDYKEFFGHGNDTKQKELTIRSIDI